MCSEYQPTHGDVYFLACNVYEVHNRWKQLCHLHIDGSPYDRITFLGPSPSSLKLCYRMILSDLLLKACGEYNAYRLSLIVASSCRRRQWEAHGWQMHWQDTPFNSLFTNADIVFPLADLVTVIL